MKSIKILILLIASALFAANAFSQVSVLGANGDNSLGGRLNIGRGHAYNTDASAYLEVGLPSGSIKGLLFPRGHKEDIASPATGLVIYDLNDHKLWQYNGSAWEQVGSTTITAGTPADTLFFTTRAWDKKGNDSLLSLILQREKYTDTAAMLFPYIRKPLAVKYTDTATMLAVYLRKADTITISNRIDLKLNKADTKDSVLSTTEPLYAKKADTTGTHLTFQPPLYKTGSLVYIDANAQIYHAGKILGHNIRTTSTLLDGWQLHYDANTGEWATGAPALGLDSTTATTLFEPIITAGTSSQYWRGDKTFQTLNTTAVPEGTGLYFTNGRVDTRLNAYTGDVTFLNGVSAIGSNKVLDAMLRTGAARSIIGRSASTSGNVADITATSSSDAVLRESGGTIGFGTIATAGIANQAVTYSKIQNVTTQTLLGRFAGTNGVTQEITIGTGLSLNSSTGVLSASGGTNAAADGTTKGIATFTAADFNDDGSGLISIDYTNGQAADASHKGFLTSANWSTFNGKAASGANTDITSVLLNQTGLVVKGATSNGLTIKPNETLTAPRTLNIVTGDADRSITLTGNTTLSGTNTGDQTISIAGDVTASGSTSALSATVTKINGTSLASLGTGILKNTTTTGVPSIAIAADFPTLNQNTTGSAATLTTPRALWGQNFDGSAAITGSLTSVGDITGGASSMIIQAGTGASRTLTFKTTTSGSTATTALTLAADQSATFANTVNATTFVGALTGTATKASNLTGGNNTTLLGAVHYQSNTDVTTLLSPNTTTTKKFLTQTGTGTNGAVPIWDVIVAGDVPTLNQNTTGSSGSVANALTIGTNLQGTTGTYNGSAGVTISLQNAAADGSTKGAAAFNSTNFSASSGVVNTIQDITTTSVVQHGTIQLGTLANSPASNWVIAGRQSANARATLVLQRQTNTTPTGDFLSFYDAAATPAKLFNVDITGAITTGSYAGTSISTTYTDAKIKTVTGTSNRITIGGTSTDPTFDISSSYVGQNTITTLGTVGTGVWNGTAIGDTYISSAATWNAKNSGIQFDDEGVALGATGTVNEVDFVGTGVTATRATNKLTVTISGGGGGGDTYLANTQTFTGKNTFSGGIAVTSYQTITSGASSTVADATTKVIFNPASDLTAYTLTLPASPIDGQEIEIIAGGTIAAGNAVSSSFTVSANTGQSMITGITPTQLYSGDVLLFTYKTSNTTWYRKK